jgi:hypothetical protein
MSGLETGFDPAFDWENQPPPPAGTGPPQVLSFGASELDQVLESEPTELVQRQSSPPRPWGPSARPGPGSGRSHHSPPTFRRTVGEATPGKKPSHWGSPRPPTPTGEYSAEAWVSFNLFSPGPSDRPTRRSAAVSLGNRPASAQNSASPPPRPPPHQSHATTPYHDSDPSGPVPVGKGPTDENKGAGATRASRGPDTFPTPFPALLPGQWANELFCRDFIRGQCHDERSCHLLHSSPEERDGYLSAMALHGYPVRFCIRHQRKLHDPSRTTPPVQDGVHLLPRDAGGGAADAGTALAFAEPRGGPRRPPVPDVPLHARMHLQRLPLPAPCSSGHLRPIMPKPLGPPYR